MADLFPVAGARIYIGAAIAVPSVDLAIADYSGVTWVECKSWTSCGAIGDAAALITTQVIGQGRDIKQKGTKNAGQMQNNFAVNSNDPGQLALIAAAQANSNYPFKIVWNDAPAVKSATATVTIASPGVVTYTGHGLSVGDQVSFATTGALPTGLTAATTYFVKAVLDANTFTLSATSGGTVINTTGTQSGVHTISTVPLPSSTYFVGIVMSAREAGGAANTVRQLQATVEINSNVLQVGAIQ